MAVRFDAAADRLLRTSDFININAVYTVMAWVYLSSDTNAQVAIWSFNNNNAGAFSGDVVGLDVDGTTLAASVAHSGTSTDTGTGLSTGTWYHIAGVRTDTQHLLVYLNGVADVDVTRDISGRGATTTRFEFGAHLTLNVNRFDGRIAHIKAWAGVAMSAAEILQEMNVIRPVRTADLHGWWPCFPGATERLAEYSGNGRSFTAGGTLTDEQEPPISFGHGVYLLPFAAAAGPTEIDATDTQALEDAADAATLLALSGPVDTQAIEDGADAVATLLADPAATDTQALEDAADSVALIALAVTDSQALEDAADTSSVFMAEALSDDDTLFVGLFADDIVSILAMPTVTDTQALEDAADAATIAAETTTTDTQALTAAADAVTLIALATTDTQAIEDGADAVTLISLSTTDTQALEDAADTAAVAAALATTDTQALEDAADTAALDTGSLTLPIVEPYTGTNGDPWNTSRWTTGAGGTGVVDIQGNQGRMLAQGGAFAYTRALSNMDPIDDMQVTGSFQVDTLSEQYWAVNLRQSAGWDAGIPANPQTGYWFEFAIAGNVITVHRGVAGTRTDISSVGFTWDDDQLYHFKAQVSGTRVRIRVWLDGSPEPATWNLSITDANVTDPGVASLSGSNGAAATAQTILWENVTIDVAPELVTATDSQALEDGADAVGTLLADLARTESQALTAAADSVTLIAFGATDTQAVSDVLTAAIDAVLSASDTQAVEDAADGALLMIPKTASDTQALTAAADTAALEISFIAPPVTVTAIIGRSVRRTVLSRSPGRVVRNRAPRYTVKRGH